MSRGGSCKIKPECCSPNLTRKRATPGRSKTHQRCFRTPCPRLWDSRPSTSTDTPPHPRRSRRSQFRLVALDPWPSEQGASNSFLSPEAPSHPRGVFHSRKGTVNIKISPRWQACQTTAEQAAQAYRCGLGWYLV